MRDYTETNTPCQCPRHAYERTGRMIEQDLMWLAGYMDAEMRAELEEEPAEEPASAEPSDFDRWFANASLAEIIAWEAEQDRLRVLWGL